jgi:hypothetical protein
VRILALTSVPFRPTEVQMPNLALIETKQITDYTGHNILLPTVYNAANNQIQTRNLKYVFALCVYTWSCREEA